MTSCSSPLALLSALLEFHLTEKVEILTLIKAQPCYKLVSFKNLRESDGMEHPAAMVSRVLP